MKAPPDETEIVKRIPCKINPQRELILAKNRPKLVGVRHAGSYAPRAWFSEAKITKEIEKLETDLAFWRELLEALDKR